MKKICLLAAGALMACLVLAACGSSGSSSSSEASTESSSESSSGSSAASEETPASGGGEVEDVKPALEYTGGKAGAADPSKSPITIGFVSQQGGIPSYPEALVTAKAAVEYINEQLGGIEGHPVKLQSCIITSSEEQAQHCAQEFLNDSSIPVITSSGISIGNEAFNETLGGGVPFIDGDAGSPLDAVAKNTILLTSGVLAVPGGMTSYIIKEYHPKSVSIIGPNQSEIQAAISFLGKSLEGQGVEVKSSQFPPNTSDLLAPLTAANAKEAEVLVPFVFTPECPAVSKALTQIGRTKPVVGLGLCAEPSVKEALGDFPKWDILFPNENPYYPEGSEEVVSYLAGLRHYAGEEAIIGGYAGFAWSSVLTAARVMNEIGAENVSRATVTKAIDGYKGPGFMDPEANCGTIKTMPAVCSLNTFMYKYLGEEKWEDPTNGKGVAPISG